MYLVFCKQKTKPFFFFLFFLFFQNALFPQETSALLENGIELSLIKEAKNPIAHISIEVGSGYSSTENNTAGYFEMLTGLFWETETTSIENNTRSKEKSLGIFDTESRLEANKTVFSASFPAHLLEEVLDYVKERLQNTFFSETSLHSIVKNYKEMQKTLITSPYGLIHGSIMQEIYPENPWAQSVDMSYFYYIDKKVDEIALDLKNIKTLFYQPQNIKLKIKSPYENEILLALSKNLVTNWNNGREKPPLPKIYEPKQKTKNLVLVSDGFPLDFEQFIFIRSLDEKLFNSAKSKEKMLQESSFISFLLEENIENTKTLFCDSPILELENEQYLEFSFENGVDSSRFISQYISKKNKRNIFEKIDEIKTLEKNISFSSETMKTALPYFKLSQENKEKKILDENFLSDVFFDYASIEPYIFVLLHPKTYESYKKSLDEKSWHVLSEKDFQKNLQKTIAEFTKENNEISSEKITTLTKIPSYENLFNLDEINTLSLKLTNGIPVLLHIETEAKETAIDFTIYHSFQSPTNYDEKSPLIDEILFRSIEEKYRQLVFEKMLNNETSEVKIFRHSTKEKTSFQIRANAKDIQEAYFDFISLFTFFTISPLEADRLHMQIQSEERIRKASLDTQLKEAALKTLFDNKKERSLFYDKTAKTHYEDIQKRLSFFYNAEGIELSFMGDEDELTALFVLSEQTLSFLKQREQIDKKIFSFEIPHSEKKQELTHIFTSNIDAKDAGPRPIKLIPTTEFFDPAHVYFQKPKNEEEAFFDAIVYAILDSINKTNTKKSFETLRYLEDETIDGLSSLEFSSVKSFSQVKTLFQNVISIFPEWIVDENNLSFLKNTWIQKSFSNYEYYSIQEKLRLQKALPKIQNATDIDFLIFFNRFIRNANAFWLISKDIQK